MHACLALRNGKHISTYLQTVNGGDSMLLCVTTEGEKEEKDKQKKKRKKGDISTCVHTFSYSTLLLVFTGITNRILPATVSLVHNCGV